MIFARRNRHAFCAEDSRRSDVVWRIADNDKLVWFEIKFVKFPEKLSDFDCQIFSFVRDFAESVYRIFKIMPESDRFEFDFSRNRKISRQKRIDKSRAFI